MRSVSRDELPCGNTNRSIAQKFTYEGFKRFVDSRNAGEKINHDGWYTCAIGQYNNWLKSTGNIPLQDYELISLVFIGLGFPVKLIDKLGTDDCTLSTYGELQQYIEVQQYIDNIAEPELIFA